MRMKNKKDMGFVVLGKTKSIQPNLVKHFKAQGG